MQIIYINSPKYGEFKCLVDDEDYESLSKFHWIIRKAKYTFYVYRLTSRKEGKRKQIQIHRQILNITNPETLLDHEDRNGLNNQKCNLRVATKSQNAANIASQQNTSSKYLGVCFDKRTGRWIAHIKSNKIQMWLGRHDTQEQAAIAYNEAAKIHHGEFANLNIIE